MTTVTSEQIKKLREQTGAGMLKCKQALDETAGDYEKAVDWLRKKGLASAAKKAGRVAAEGLIAIAQEGNKSAIIEINSETDFVARNEKFQILASNIAKLTLQTSGDIEQLKSAEYPNTGRNVADEITENIATIGENLNLRRSAFLSVENGAKKGIVASYIHSAIAPGLGKIGVITVLESEAPADKLQEIGKKIAMHIAAQKPEAISVEELDPSKIEREKQVFTDQAKASGKPDNIIEKMVEGRIRKYYEEVVLPEQGFVMDPKIKVSKILEDAGKEAGTAITVTKFVRFAIGEGIEKEEENFAEAVAKAANG